MKPCQDAHYWQADQIAECLNVSTETYSELWNKIVPLYDSLPRGECPGEISYGVADYWDHLSPEAQADVNRALGEL